MVRRLEWEGRRPAPWADRREGDDLGNPLECTQIRIPRQRPARDLKASVPTPWGPTAVLGSLGSADAFPHTRLFPPPLPGHIPPGPLSIPGSDSDLDDARRRTPVSARSEAEPWTRTSDRQPTSAAVCSCLPRPPRGGCA